MRASQLHFDLNVGVQWTKTFGKFNPAVGLAMHHVNRPKDSYFDPFLKDPDPEKYSIRHFLSTAKEFVSETAYFNDVTAKANDMVLGSSVSKLTGDVKIPEINAGVYYRHGVNRNIRRHYSDHWFSLQTIRHRSEL